MSIFFFILSNNILPIFIIIGLGFLIGKKYDICLFSLNKLMFFLFVPTFIFYNLYTVTNISLDLLKIVLFCITYQLTSSLLAVLTAKIRKYELGLTNAFKNSVMFNNSGNIGLSLIILIFSREPYIINGQTPYLDQAMAAQVIILVFVNITMNTFGIYNAGRANMNLKDSIRKVLTMPSIYAIPLAFILKYFDLNFSATPIWSAITLIKNGLVPMALITLGVQLSKTELKFNDLDVNLAVFIRLVIGPVLALGFIRIFGFSGVIAQALLISYAMPTAVNTALIAIECQNHPAFASRQVMVSTIFSAATLTLVIYAAGILFPV